ncbi:MAG: hypothetical protein D6728_18855 [Cyanobacteria bacterium J055]|nr:MAG: hypothetical protein D6728_18855 [Cyanobacteria bacterium J055]
MGKHLNELENIEQELATLQTHLEKSFGVLEGLARIPSQFEDFGRTYQQMQEYAAKAQTHLEETDRIEKRFEQRCLELEALMESRLSEIRSELAGVRDQLQRDRNNEEQFDRLKTELEEKVSAILQEWTGSNDENLAPIKEIDARLNHLDTRTHMARKYMQQMENQVRALRGGMVFAVVAAIASAAFAIFNWNGPQGQTATDLDSSFLFNANGQLQDR